MNAKHQRFVAEYLTDLNATQAAIRAGYSKKTARQIGDELLSKPDIAAAVAAQQQKHLDKAELSATRVLEEMKRLGFSNVADLFDARGDLRPIHLLSREQSACIAAVEVVMKNATAGDGKIDRVLKIKLWDKPKVMEMLAKHFALLTDVVRHEGDSALIEALHAGRQRAAGRKK